ncbi:MAG: hypothetical protein WAQ24_04600 [Candidatus Saccharimonadales bacterium]
MRSSAKLISAIGLVLGSAMVVGLAAFLAKPSVVSALYTCDDNAILAFGRNSYCGYFDNGSYASGGALFPGGIYPSGSTSVQKAENFFQIVEDRYYSGGSEGRASVSFLVLTMLGRPAGSPWLEGTDDPEYLEWQAIVRSYAAQGRITWNYAWPWNCGQINTMLGDASDTYEKDIFPYVTTSGNTFSPPCGSGVPPVDTIIFTNPDGSEYIIKKSCGNPIGDVGALQDLNQVPIGDLETANCTTVSGWGYDPDQPSKYLNYYLVINGTKKGPYKADQSRPDVNSSEGITGNHGFSLAINTFTEFKPRDANLVQILLIDKDTGQEDDLGSRTFGPCNKASCIVPSNFQANMQVGAQYGLKPQIKLDYAWGPSYHTGATASAYDPKMHIKIIAPNGATVKDEDVAYDAGYPIAGTVLTANPTNTPSDAGVPFVPTMSGEYKFQWSLSGKGLNVTCPGVGGGGGDGYEHGKAGYHPYFTVTGGDILSGGDIQSWNQDSGTYAGAGSQLAALATGNIKNFVTGFGLSGGAAANSGSGLAFANTTKAGTTYGGGYSVPTFVPTVTGPTIALPGSVIDLSTLMTGTYTYAGNVVLHGQVPQGQNITLVLTSGSVFIDGNITYAPYTNFVQMPRLTVIVQNGNVGVAPNVTEIHGVFYAGRTTPTDNTKGNFYSCATDADTTVNLGTPTAYATCNSQLTVYGAVATANKLILSRTYGNVAAAPGVLAQPAEVFYYSPELWLAPPDAATGGAPIKPSSYLSLPPVL